MYIFPFIFIWIFFKQDYNLTPISSNCIVGLEGEMTQDTSSTGSKMNEIIWFLYD
jgi:hypothetical protein